MSSVWWIKIRTDMFSDEKIRLIEQLPESDGIVVIWVKLLALAGQKNAGGEIFVNDEMPYTDEMLAAIFQRPVNLIRLALQTFQKFRMIEVASNLSALRHRRALLARRRHRQVMCRLGRIDILVSNAFEDVLENGRAFPLVQFG